MKRWKRTIVLPAEPLSASVRSVLGSDSHPWPKCSTSVDTRLAGRWRQSFVTMLFSIMLGMIVACLWRKAVAAVDEPIVSTVSDKNKIGNKASDGVEVEHGHLEVLSELLIRDRQAENLVRSLKSQPLSESGFEDLQAVFAQPFDSYRIDRSTDIIQNSHEAALQLLRSAPKEIQRRWSSRLDDAANLKVSQCESSDQFLLVERQFPLSEAGLRSGLAGIGLLHLRGLHRYADAQLSLLETKYDGTFLEPLFREWSRPIQVSISRLRDSSKVKPSTPQDSDIPPEVHLSVRGQSSVKSIGPAWPRSMWTWAELLEDFPGAPQPATLRDLLPFVKHSETWLGDFNNWRPILVGDSLIHRSPLRIVAFHQRSGKELWSIPTDTIRRTANDSGKDSVSQNSLNFGAISSNDVGIISIRDLAAYGLMSVDEDYLYFLDSVPLIKPEDSSSQRSEENVIGFRQYSMGTVVPLPQRLVAVRLSDGDLPTVAWTVGQSNLSKSNTQFQYSVRATLDQASTHEKQSALSAIIGDEAPESESGRNEDVGYGSSRHDVPQSIGTSKLNGHQFLAPPCGCGDQLWVVTEYSELTYLSCLSKTDGKMLWQRPLSYIGHRDSNSAIPVTPRGMCLFCKGILVCLLHEGVAIGVRPADGQILWATAFSESQVARPDERILPGFLPAPDPLTQPTVVSMANSSLVVAMDPAFSNVVGIEPETGHIRWQVSSSLIGTASIDGSFDSYIAGVTESHVVLVGTGHCRALDVKTGDQIWVTEISKSSGRAVVSGDACLVPGLDGQLMSIELSAGKLFRPRQRFLPENAQHPWGAIVCSDTQVFAVSPVAVEAYLRCDAALQDDEILKSIDSERSVLTKARLLLIDQREDEAIELLRTSLAEQPSAETSEFQQSNETHDAETGIGRTLAEVILQRWAELYVQALSETHTFDRVSSVPDSVPTSEIPEVPSAEETRHRLSSFGESSDAMLLGELDLHSDQQLRAAVLALLSRPDFELQADHLAELESFPEWTQSLPLTDDWSVRPDLLLYRSVASKRELPENIDQANLATCRLFAERAVLFPDFLEDPILTERFANRLIRLQEYAAAESVLMVWQRTCPTQQATKMLAELRSPQFKTKLDESKSIPAGLTTPLPQGKEIQFATTDQLETFFFNMFVRNFETATLPLEKVCSKQLPYNLRIVDLENLKSQISFAANDDGTIVSSLELPHYLDQPPSRHFPVMYDDARPSLLPFVGQNELMMVNCTKPEQPSLIWSKPVSSDAAKVSTSETVEFGPLGPDFMIWHSDGVLRCVHPVTGNELWSRRMKFHPAVDGGLPRIFGDENVIIVLNETHTRFERYRTRDGQLLGIGSISMSGDGDAATVGRFIVYCDPEGRIRLFDGLIGRDRLAEAEPIYRPRTFLPQSFFVISERRVVTVTNENKIAIIDVMGGKVETQIPVQQHLMTDEVFALTAFEQNGRLYVGIEDEVGLQQNLTASEFNHGPRIRFGILFSVDTKGSRLFWHVRLQNKRFLTPSGDPTDILVAIEDRSFASQQFEYKRSSFYVTLIDGNTGAQMAEETISSRLPYRISHSAADELIELSAKETVTRITLQHGSPMQHSDQPTNQEMAPPTENREKGD